MRLIVAGGGTGGHLFPGIAVAEEFLSRDPANEVLFVGTERGIEARQLPRLGYRLACIEASGLKGRGLLGQLRSLWRLLHGYAQSRQILKEFHPDLVLGVGGYASAPLVLAARGMQIPRFIHEQNAVPGLTNRLLSRVAELVFTSLPEGQRHLPAERTLLTGNPLRRAIREACLQPAATADDGCHRLLVFGGSAGAHSINQAMAAALPELRGLAASLRILHQTGEADREFVAAAYAAAGLQAEVVPFIDDMAAAYRWADLVLCRAGATTIAEVTATGKACLFIPYPYAADDHQRRNAEALVNRGAGRMLLDHQLAGGALAVELQRLLTAPEELAALGRAARELARPDAARLIVDAMLACLRPGPRQEQE